MEKNLCFVALGVAGLMTLLFVMDLVVKFPFGGEPFMLVDIFGILASAIVGYMGFNALRDIR